MDVCLFGRFWKVMQKNTFFFLFWIFFFKKNNLEKKFRLEILMEISMTSMTIQLIEQIEFDQFIEHKKQNKN